MNKLKGFGELSWSRIYFGGLKKFTIIVDYSTFTGPMLTFEETIDYTVFVLKLFSLYSSLSVLTKFRYDEYGNSSLFFAGDSLYDRLIYDFISGLLGFPAYI